MAKDPNQAQMNEQMQTTTRMMKDMLDNIDLEGIDLTGPRGTALRFNCYGTFGTFGTATGCFGTAGTFGCRTLAKAPAVTKTSPTKSKR
jgi:hypothetical protein